MDYFAVAVANALAFRETVVPAVEPPRVQCRDCAWHGDVSGGFLHWQQTQHAVTYRGHVQSFQRVLDDQQAGRTPIVRPSLDEPPAPIWRCRECGFACPAGSDVHESCAGFRAHIERGGTLD